MGDVLGEAGHGHGVTWFGRGRKGAGAAWPCPSLRRGRTAPLPRPFGTGLVFRLLRAHPRTASAVEAPDTLAILPGRARTLCLAMLGHAWPCLACAQRRSLPGLERWRKILDIFDLFHIKRDMEDFPGVEVDAFKVHLSQAAVMLGVEVEHLLFEVPGRRPDGELRMPSVLSSNDASCWETPRGRLKLSRIRITSYTVSSEVGVSRAVWVQATARTNRDGGV